MQKMRYQDHRAAVRFALPKQVPLAAVAPTDWRRSVPVLSSDHVTLRELRISDAPSLFAAVTGEDVTRFISTPPSSVEGFERFIAWAQRQRLAGLHVCFAVTIPGSDEAVGLLQLRAMDEDFATAEWGFVLGSRFWGRGVFVEAATLVLRFAFETIGVHRLEARAAARNGRGNAALLKIGAVPEATLRAAFLCRGERIDQTLYSILADDWRASQAPAWVRGMLRGTVH